VQGEDFLCPSNKDIATNSRNRPTRYPLANSRLLPSQRNLARALRSLLGKKKQFADSYTKHKHAISFSK
jgi:hypothetical protein